MLTDTGHAVEFSNGETRGQADHDAPPLADCLGGRLLQAEDDLQGRLPHFASQVQVRPSAVPPQRLPLR